MNLKDETKHGVLAIVFFVLAVFLALAWWGKAGIAGTYIADALDTLLGIGYLLLPVMFLLLGISFLKETRPNFALPATIGGILFFLSALGLVAIGGGEHAGGLIGHAIASPLVRFFDVPVSSLLLGAILIISIIVIFDTKPDFGFERIAERFAAWRTERKERARQEKERAALATTAGTASLEVEDLTISGAPSEEEFDEDEYEEEAEEDDGTETEEEEEPAQKEIEPRIINGTADSGAAKYDPVPVDIASYSSGISFTPPPLGILEGDKGKPGVGDIKANANIIKRTLQNFGIEVEMDEVSIGPSVTRYAFKPAEGVRLQKIISLQNNLELALAASPVRIEAPIPGKSLVGIEVPNSTRTTVGLKSLLGDKEFQETQKPLLFALGRGVTGKLHFADLAKMPHMLVAGTTGSGKSVMVHSIINSLLFHNPPEQLRFIMVDPKRVELSLYNKKIPHLLTPVITDPKKTILALKWAAKEMERRYDVLQTESVRDISSYHKNIVEPAYAKAAKDGADEEDVELPERMPYIVIIIDELSDIMSSYPRELEAAIVRLAQMSRAVGIHLILSTQRPSVNVITGLIKANVPARIAFQVASQIDSRTILDMGGAEKLLGAGDMLYMSGDMAKPVRLQSPFLSEAEVKKITAFFVKHYGSAEADDINFTNPEGGKTSLFETALDGAGDEEEDDLYEDARALVIEAGKASTSLLQRRLKVGYSRAARLIDMLESRGVVGPADGSKPRQVLEGGSSSESDSEDDE